MIYTLYDIDTHQPPLLHHHCWLHLVLWKVDVLNAHPTHIDKPSSFEPHFTRSQKANCIFRHLTAPIWLAEFSITLCGECTIVYIFYFSSLFFFVLFFFCFFNILYIYSGFCHLKIKLSVLDFEAAWFGSCACVLHIWYAFRGPADQPSPHEFNLYRSRWEASTRLDCECIERSHLCPK